MSPEQTQWVRHGLMLAIFALMIRTLGAVILGQGAAFGPDGTGADAAVFLGGHPYPLHIVLLRFLGLRSVELSMLSGSLSCVMLWWWGQRVGLTGAGGWLAATMPLCVFPGVLSAGDAPAIAVAMAGILLSTAGKRWELLGGALAALCVAVKPIALPVLVLLAVRPVSLLGAMGVLGLLRQFTRPLWSPMSQGGLLGTWWVASEGRPPDQWMQWIADGLGQLVDADPWGLVWVFPLVVLVGMFSKLNRSLRLTAIGVGAMALWTASLFGGRLELRYLGPAFLAAVPFLAAVLSSPMSRRIAVGLALWPTFALLTQVAEVRAELDAEASVPELPVLRWPLVDARPIFDACSTEDATHLRNMAFQLAAVAPEGSTVITDARPDGREGELFWPLLVLRPDLKVQAR